jgi:methyltransferase
MVVGMIFGLVVVIITQRIAELLLAKCNRKWALKQGACEYGADHYPIFFIIHIAWLIGWVFEADFKNTLSNFWPAWLSLFLFAQVIRYWCIITLGRFWNTRILVIPGCKAVRSGPYRYLKHPNYLAVAIELAAVPLIFNAFWAAALATCANAALLLLVRIPAEEHALLLLLPVDCNQDN